ncbi:MAG: hypothetical protein MJ198_01995 [Bacteroidales bacterium]|nr:hypothetical protein [Bacteroidales bacterium]
MKIKKLLVLLLGIILAAQSFSQTENFREPARVESYLTELYPEAFNLTLMRDAILYYIDRELKNEGCRILQPNQILQGASQEFADYMGKTDEIRVSYAPSKYVLQQRLMNQGGGVHQADEITMKTSIQRAKISLTYDEVAQDIVFQIFKRKSVEILQNPGYVFAGIGCAIDKTGKKLYISISVGNYNLLTASKKEIKESGLKLTTSNQGIGWYDAKACKACAKYKEMESIRSMVSIDRGKIYFETSDYKSFKKLMKDPTDAIAVDIVNIKQYPCNGSNIVNNQLPSRGFMTKPVYVKDFDKLNIYAGRNSSSKLRLLLGELPEGVTDYEYNVLIIKDKHLCKTLTPSYEKKIEGFNMPELLPFPDTVTRYNTFVYTPKVERDTISFIIPFEIGRSQYRPEDIIAFVDSMKQPDFQPLAFIVSAYTSVDGNPEKNMQLRGERINTIVSSIASYSGNKVPISTQSKDSWDLFYTDIVATEWQFLKTKSHEEVLAYISKGDNLKKMDGLLSKHRFAEVQIVVEYDISTKHKEQSYSVYAFHKALKEYNEDRALAVQKYIMQQVLSGRYPKTVIDKMQIPDKPAYVGLQVNKMWLDYTANNKPIDEKFLKEMQRLKTLNPTHPYVRRNLVFARLKLETIDNEYYVTEMQKDIDEQLISKLPKYAIDPLNLELQVKSLQNLNKTYKVSNEEEFVNAAFERIKEIIEIDDNDWKGALNIASIFAGMNDYDYPVSVMAPMIKLPNVSEEFVFAFISMCTHTDYMYHNQAFIDALVKAAEMNKPRLCELVDTGKLSFQMFENPEVKKAFCPICNQ